VEGEQGGARHAVLQPGPRRPPERLLALRRALVETADAPAECQDLLPRELEP
jgi:hypothetical protein